MQNPPHLLRLRSFLPLNSQIPEHDWYHITQQEMYYGNTYYSFEELKETIEKYIVYYNEKRIKEKLGWMSPVEYRLSAMAA